jgi:hypothetical protein
MRAQEEVALALALVAEGLNDCEIGRRTGIPRGTIRDWRHGKTPGRGRRRPSWESRGRKYLRYTFDNASADIRRIFCDACDQLGIPWRQPKERTISIARREGVAMLDSFIGPKS